jgi:hypothetical protein
MVNPAQPCARVQAEEPGDDLRASAMTDNLEGYRTGAGIVGAVTVLMVAATPAAAYVGPGAGLSLLGALWGVLFAVFAALAFVVIWPIRRLIKRRAARTYRMGSPSAAAPAEEQVPRS